MPLWRTVYQLATANQLRDFYALSLVATAVLYIVCMALRLRQTPGDE